MSRLVSKYSLGWLGLNPDQEYWELLVYNHQIPERLVFCVINGLPNVDLKKLFNSSAIPLGSLFGAFLINNELNYLLLLVWLINSLSISQGLREFFSLALNKM